MQRSLRVLGRGVTGPAVVDLHCRDRRDGDDQAVAGGDQFGQQRTSDPQRAQHVGFPHPPPVLQVGVGHRLQALGAAGVVDQHVDPAQPGGQFVDCGPVGDVDHNCRAADLGGQRVDPVSPPRHRHHVKALRGEGSRGRFADARARAGDDRDARLAAAAGRGRRREICGTHPTNSSKRAKFLVCLPAPCSAFCLRVVTRTARVVVAQSAAPERTARARDGARPGPPSKLGQGHPTCVQPTSPPTLIIIPRPRGGEPLRSTAS